MRKSDRFKYDPSLAFYVDLAKHDGAKFMSDDAYGHLCTNVNTTWTPEGGLFAGAEYITAPAATSQLDFTTEDFSLIARVRTINLTASNELMAKGRQTGEGWNMTITSVGAIELRTNQMGGSQLSASVAGAAVINTWYTLGFSRTGASVRIYKEGADVTSIVGTHINPDSGVAQPVGIGVSSQLTSRFWKGTIWKVLCFNRSLSPVEHLERHRDLSLWQYA